MASGRHQNRKPEGKGSARLDETFPKGIEDDPM